MPSWLLQSWMHLKLTFVALLIVYHLKTHRIFLKLQKNKIDYSEIVFLAILKDGLHWIGVTLGILGLGVILFLGIRLYKKIRKDI